MSKNQEYKSLIRRFYAKKATVSDMEKIRNLVDDEVFLQAWEDIWYEDGVNKTGDLQKPDDTMFERIMEDDRIKKNQHVQPPISYKRRSSFWKYWTAAASVLFMAAIALLMHQSPIKKQRLTHNPTDEQVLPGEQRAQIVLQDGSYIDLATLQEDTLLQMDGFSIQKGENGMITYLLDEQATPKDRIVFNSIITPKGGEYALVLPDGTKVWLNAATKLRYPIVFNEEERIVQMEGEAYFEVNKSEHEGRRIPFIVETGSQRLEVLGTIFNIKAYQKNVVTTLVEGKVKLSFSHESMEDKVLNPHDQVIFDSEKKQCATTKVDPLYTIAWKNGNFAFTNATIYEVMDDIARWYNVEIAFKNINSKARFSGTLSRYENMDKTLNLIAMAAGIQFKVEGRKVDVIN